MAFFTVLPYFIQCVFVLILLGTFPQYCPNFEDFCLVTRSTTLLPQTHLEVCQRLLGQYSRNNCLEATL